MPSFCRAAIDNLAVIFLWRSLAACKLEVNLSCDLFLLVAISQTMHPRVTSQHLWGVAFGNKVRKTPLNTKAFEAL